MSSSRRPAGCWLHQLRGRGCALCASLPRSLSPRLGKGRSVRRLLSELRVNVSFALPLRLALTCFFAAVLIICALWSRAAGAGAGTAVVGTHASFAPPRPPAPPAARLRIPRTVHQTVAPGKAGARQSALRSSWSEQNPGWTVRSYSDTQAAAFVATEFPEHFGAYRQLGTPVARADLFRVLVLLRRGGVYADADTACAAPLDGLLRLSDTLVAGWENSFASAAQADARHYVRTRQLLNWALAAAPGHPALQAAAAAIVAAAPSFAAAPAQAEDPRGYQAFVLSRTGPGVLTDELLAWYSGRFNGSGGISSLDPNAEGGPAPAASVWTLRLLPRVALGTHPRPGSADGVSQLAPGVVVSHAFRGSWKRKRGVERLPWPLRPLLRPLARLVAPPPPAASPAEVATRVRGSPPGTRYPVSATSWDPLFDLLLPPPSPPAAWRGTHALAAQHLFDWGMPFPRAQPHAAQQLLLPVTPGRRLFVDVGAGLGYYALAAAASGHAVLALEPDAKALSLLSAAAWANRLAPLVAVSAAALGAPQSPAFQRAWLRAGDGAGDGAVDGADGAAGDAGGRPRRHWRASLEGVFSLDAALSNASSGALPLRAVRIAARGWEGWVLDGGTETLGGGARAPRAVLVETAPSRLAQSGWGDVAMLWDRFRAWGYTQASHAGPACDSELRRAPDDPQPSQWCDLSRRDAAALVFRVPPHLSEQLLFTRPEE